MSRKQNIFTAKVPVNIILDEISKYLSLKDKLSFAKSSYLIYQMMEPSLKTQKDKMMLDYILEGIGDFATNDENLTPEKKNYYGFLESILQGNKSIMDQFYKDENVRSFGLKDATATTLALNNGRFNKKGKYILESLLKAKFVFPFLDKALHFFQSLDDYDAIKYIVRYLLNYDLIDLYHSDKEIFDLILKYYKPVQKKELLSILYDPDQFLKIISENRNIDIQDRKSFEEAVQNRTNRRLDRQGKIKLLQTIPQYHDRLIKDLEDEYKKTEYIKIREIIDLIQDSKPTKWNSFMSKFR